METRFLREEAAGNDAWWMLKGMSSAGSNLSGLQEYQDTIQNTLPVRKGSESDSNGTRMKKGLKWSKC